MAEEHEDVNEAESQQNLFNDLMAYVKELQKKLSNVSQEFSKLKHTKGLEEIANMKGLLSNIEQSTKT